MIQANDLVLKMYRWQELRALLAHHSCPLVDASAGSTLTTGRSKTATELAPDAARWQDLLDWELRGGREPGALHAVAHISAVVRRHEA